MTDVYISCANADAERVAPVVEALKAEGWSVWYEPDTNSERREYAIDAELGAAGAVIVLWSSHSRDLEAVRTEAATGLYRNKLIQISMGGETPPRPFDQLEVIDLGRWSGEESDPVWQRILGCIRLFAGSPGAHRPQVVRNSARGFGSEAAARPSARPVNAPPPVEQVAQSDDLNGSSPETVSEHASEQARVEPEPIRIAPKHVFDEPIEDAPPSAARVDRSLGVADQDQSHPTVTPGATASPIDQAVSEMERKISSAAQPTDYAPLPDVESQSERAWNAEPEANEPEAYETSSHETEPYEPAPYEPEPYRQEAYEPEPQPPKSEPIRFAPVGGFDAPSAKRGDRDWMVSRDDRDWIADEMAAATENDVFARPGSAAARPRPQAESRSNGIAPVAIVGALAVIGGAVWFVDPMGWRVGGEKAAFAESPAGGVEAGPVLPVATGPLSEDPVAREAWAGVDRTDPEALRSFIFEYSDTYSAETAHALLRALDAQAWADAVTADIEAGYQSYLAEFPAPNGEMAGAASNRLASLGAERKQAITAIQVQLGALNIYRGQTTGEADAASQRAADQFASRSGAAAPVLEHAAPRDLRAFGDQLLAAVRAEAGQGAGSAQVAALAVRAEPVPETGAAARPAPEAPTAVERQPVAAPEAVTEAPAEDASSADSLASEALQRAAWESASRAGTIEAYGAFLRDYPDSQNVIAARAAIEQLSRPAAYGLDWLSDDTRTWVAAAREAQQQARGRAAAARERAGEADEVATAARSGLAEARTVVAPDGDIYETQVSNNQPNGLGVRTAGDAQSSGDRYRGELRDGLGQGLGVYEFGDNPNNQAAQAQRYEGEHINDVARGYGVTQWRNGNRFEGQDNGEAERGVMIFANGQRYEGQMLNGNRHGYGVFWTADGEVMMAGRWENGDLVEPMAPHEGPDFEAIMASAPVLTTASGPADASDAIETDEAADNASE